MGTLEVDAVIERDAFSVRVCLVARHGEVIGLGGDIGSGKSTVLAAIAGMLPIASGRICFDGDTWDDAALGLRVPTSRRPVGYLPQRPVFADEMTGTELLEADGCRRAEELGVRPDVVARAAWTWSGGETQRIALVRALQGDPQVLLLDDPFAALDRRTGTMVRDWLGARLAERTGPTVLVAADPADLTRFATQIVPLA